MYLRLRQICLVATDLEKAAGDLGAILGAEVAYRDTGVEKYGLHNVLFALGGTFLEVVSPLREGTAAGRYIERRKGDGGYMYILDCNDLEARRDHIADMQVRIVEDIKRSEPGGASEAIHLHPKDTGCCLLSIDRHSGGEDMMGEYLWAGPDWQDKVKPDVHLAGAEMQCDDPQATAQTWGLILKRSVIDRGGNVWDVRLDNAYARFVPLNGDRGEGLSEIAIRGASASSVAAAAKQRGLKSGEGWVEACGVRINLES